MSLRKQQPSATTTSNETHGQIGSFIGEERNCWVQPGRVPPLVRTQMALYGRRYHFYGHKCHLCGHRWYLCEHRWYLCEHRRHFVRTQTALERCAGRSSVSLLHLKRGTSKDAVLQNIFFILNKRAGRFLQNKS
jgi:hypothetical protein